MLPKDTLGGGEVPCPLMPSTPQIFRVAELDVIYADLKGYYHLTQLHKLAGNTFTSRSSVPASTERDHVPTGPYGEYSSFQSESRRNIHIRRMCMICR